MVVTSVIFIGGYGTPQAMSTKVVVTGASGRVGRAVLAELANAGDYEVWAVDRTLPPPGSAGRSLLVDLSDAGSVYGALAGADAVIHLGAYPSTAHHPGEQVFTNNSAATAHVSAACGALGIRRVVYASSITTYGLEEQTRQGKVQALPLDESLGPAPDDFYALSKWVGEEIFTLGAQEHGLHVASLRIALVVGPDEYAERGHPRGERDASAGLWAYVDSRDVAQAARLALEHLDDLGTGNHPFNVGAGDAHSEAPLSEVIPRFVPALAPLAAGLSGTSPAYGIEKARRLLGYAPRHSWRTELSR
ncbi:MAG TPA: NAD(P)-dependent oxidoreductase [Chloroflexota bacterium]|nr:NAD(P)-dependent oxidoreductase [Chloroflexota bacterium]